VRVHAREENTLGRAGLLNTMGGLLNEWEGSDHRCTGLENTQDRQMDNRFGRE